MAFQKGHKMLPGAGFQKGHKPYGNALGKPINRMIDACGDTQDLVQFLHDVANAKVRDPVNPEAFLFIPINWRVDAAKWILERQHGKAQQNIDVTSHEGAPQAIDYGRFTDAQLIEIERLHAIGSVEAVDAEFTPALALLPEGKK